jgi:mRNA interferase MazF
MTSLKRARRPGFERPVAILQGDALNRSTIQTAVVIVLTSNLRAASAAGNVLLAKKDTGLDRDSVANVSRLATIDRGFLRNHSGRLPPAASHDARRVARGNMTKTRLWPKPLSAAKSVEAPGMASTVC